MDEENFEIFPCETPRLASLYLFIVTFRPSPWLIFCLILPCLTLRIGWIIFIHCHIHTVTMGEENFEIRPSETPQIGLIILIYCYINTFTMVEEIFEILPC